MMPLCRVSRVIGRYLVSLCVIGYVSLRVIGVGEELARGEGLFVYRVGAFGKGLTYACNVIVNCIISECDTVTVTVSH
ncbi:hypothetical protein EB796_012840 [Bugula neritina]|uniref:Uncharacterized protein n=1 Tax=Bugula neritina TaxID=10212 RepID=A0A7J7JSE1_BUGNE|nr:hypothetical protein EB796_012840 [Bugula neritina]